MRIWNSFWEWYNLSFWMGTEIFFEVWSLPSYFIMPASRCNDIPFQVNISNKLNIDLVWRILFKPPAAHYQFFHHFCSIITIWITGWSMMMWQIWIQKNTFSLFRRKFYWQTKSAPLSWRIQGNKYDKIFLMSCLFRTWVITALYNFFVFII